MKEIGLVKLEDMGTMPFFSVHHAGKRLKRTKSKHCEETGGDCMEFVNKYLDIKWNNPVQTTDTWTDNYYPPRLCTPEEVT